ncbi:MAG: ABC transporter ATP-binding protein [Myxococcales bacterium]|nr:ABC transporter ATP-binding protein [Myxococcales bacterium]
MSLIELRNVTKDYDLGKVKVSALKHVDLMIESGEFTVIAGPSGSGKTTLLNIIGLLDAKTSGTYSLDDVSIEHTDFDDLATMRNEKIGFIFQNFNLIPVLDVRENVEFPLLFSAKPPDDAQDYIDRLVEQVGLSAFVKHRPDELSGGQRQRVAIARALATRPRLVIADEPTANLDTETAMTIIELMEKLNREMGVTFIFSTHDHRLISRAHRVVELQDGSVVPSDASTDGETKRAAHG